ncbi:hypothetical protein [Caenibacillus caldisaponilyticus]|uniref:hypothetical protein n=1 Tax=Caenibacillus caldisaponilyticus TaxID=1674942 RepID=UPI000988668F|nr:hypothetical protein [Caenibacillus caldisaponilyticus]
MHIAKVYYDFRDGQERPIWYVVNNDFDWNLATQYIDVLTPYKKASLFDFENHLINVSVFIQEMTQSYAHPNKLGLNLLAIADRIRHDGIEPNNVDQLIMLVNDIEEVLHMNIF